MTMLVEAAFERFILRKAGQTNGETEDSPPAEYEPWLAEYFPDYTTAPLAEHHHRIWRWVWALKRGTRPSPLVVLLARGGAKSTTAELAVVAAGAHDARRYCLYVSGTQKQADDHVSSIAAMLESEPIEAAYPRLSARSLNKFGASKGWRHNRLRTAAGLTVDALGLDVDVRGIKLDEQRPDLIVFDDVDDSADSIETTKKKIRAITHKILPAGSPDVATLFVQNVVHYESIAARLAGLASEEADFLADREVIGPIPALVGFRAEKIPGTVKWRVTGGTPTWIGQDRAACQQHVDDWGIKAFRAEAQHERVPPEGQAFPEWDPSVHVMDPFPIPASWPRWRAIDYGYAVPFCCLWMTRHPSGTFILYRELYGAGLTASEQALQVKILSTDEAYKASLGDPAMWASNREGQAVKSVARQYKELGVRLEKAANERLAGKERVHAALDWDEATDENPDGWPPRLMVFRTCTNTVRTFPLLVKDPNHPEDVETDADDHCLVGGTLVETEHGPVPIADLVGTHGRLYTHDGRLVPFFDVRLTRAEARVVTVTMTDGRSVTCTDDHRMLAADGAWIEAGALTPGRMMQSVIIPTWTRSPSPPRSKSFRASVSTCAATISSVVGSVSTWLSGRRPTAPSRRDITSTIATSIDRTTDSPILRPSWAGAISVTTPLSPPSVSALPDERMSSVLLRGTDASPLSSARLLASAVGRIGSASASSARCAESPSSRPSRSEPSSAGGRAKPRPAVVASVRPAGRARVYDVAVDDPSHALAVNGGLVVHNCYDCLRYLLMKADAPPSVAAALGRAMRGTAASSTSAAADRLAERRAARARRESRGWA